MNTPTFEQFSDFLRRFAGLSPEIVLAHATKLEAELGITGDDGVDLLKETEREYGVSLSTPEVGYRSSFGLAADEYLFNSEGFDLLGLFRRKEKVIEFTVGQLYDAVIKQIRTIRPTEPRLRGPVA